MVIQSRADNYLKKTVKHYVLPLVSEKIFIIFPDTIIMYYYTNILYLLYMYVYLCAFNPSPAMFHLGIDFGAVVLLPLIYIVHMCKYIYIYRHTHLGVFVYFIIHTLCFPISWRMNRRGIFSWFFVAESCVVSHIHRIII